MNADEVGGHEKGVELVGHTNSDQNLIDKKKTFNAEAKQSNQ